MSETGCEIRGNGVWVMIEQLAVMQAMRGFLCLGPTSGLYSDIDESI